ncbi:hypothetical protein RAF48_15815 [Klebsiella pneumoniae]|uniref:hypothetical protein n=1 Tax=Klebsiella pneumoniae TaxID=573 RepID=UPI001F0FB59B|nr:hypothetical protein [Klebsiella pneumoniae]UMU87407.1 hypothetical protein HZT31_18905 [Klebsiella pneumoniae]HBR1008118.1 hypothetical protein [Klebsiella pneumoniae]HDS6800546.1 hypothetical protein [Klebsiella pneumoniae]
MNRRGFIRNFLPLPLLLIGGSNQSSASQPLTTDRPSLNGDGGEEDHASKLQSVLDYAASLAKKVPNGYQKTEIFLSGVFNVRKALTIDANKVCITGPATLLFDIEIDKYCIEFNGVSDVSSAYTNNVGALFDSINFFSRRKTDLFYCAASTLGDKNPVCLMNITKCRFTGFDCIFTNGPGGWGWTWSMCGFNSCQTLLKIKREKETYERYTFVSCIWQNGGVAFYVDNPDGKIYWSDGSFDYCKSIAIISNGHVQISGHVEFKGRNRPLVQLSGIGSSFTFNGGSIFIRKNVGRYVMFEQEYDNQISLIGVNFLSDGVNLDDSLISNRKYNSYAVNFGNEKTKDIMKNIPY